jgi:HEAT repeat protein
MGLRKTGTPEPLHAVQTRDHARDTAGLLAQLRQGDAGQRRWAARDLAAQPEAASALGAALLTERDGAVRDALFTSLSAQVGDAAVAALLPLLRSEDAGLRNGAIEALAGMPDAVASRIAGLLRDADADVRIFTVNLLGELRHPQVRPWLLQVLQEDTEVNVAAAALEVLAEVAGPQDLPLLAATKRRFAGDAFIGFAADLAIERIQAA